MDEVINIGLVSLGCPKALVDSERILTQLRSEGYHLTNDYFMADLVIINTCGFIDPAREESLDAIQEALEENGKVIVTGCLGAEKEVILEEFPEVLAVTGPHDYQAVMDIVHQYCPKPYNPYIDVMPAQGIKLTPAHYAYLKISEGCNHSCSFCIIPQLRGKLESRSLNAIMQEAENLVNAGVKELLIISQDTSAYGVDLSYKLDFYRGRPVKSNLFNLASLLGELGVWIRLHYVYPYPHVDDIIPLMQQKQILPYLDIPLQHANAKILKAMRRPATGDNMLKRIEKWREICPDIALRSSFIVGFPGETEQDFNELLDFLQAAQLDKVGCFTYDAVAGANANQLKGIIPEEVKQARMATLMELQAKISQNKLKKRIGQRLSVLVDAIEDEVAIARSFADAPEIDGNVFIQDGSALTIGSLVEVEIIDADTYDLYAKTLSL